MTGTASPRTGTGVPATARSIRVPARPRRRGPDLAREREILADLPPGSVVLGVDEVGRGALAGPVSVGVCAVGPATGVVPDGLNDSKLLAAAVRESLVEPVRAWAVSVAVGHASPAEIDAQGIVAAQRLAARRALVRVTVMLDAMGLRAAATILDGKHDWLATPPAVDLFDALAPTAVEGAVGQGLVAVPDTLTADTRVPPVPEWHVPVECEVKADMRCASVAGASVVAKVERDALMSAAAARPDLAAYGLDGNKGYGSSAHRAAIAEIGASSWHRRSWRLPVRGGGMMEP